MCTKSMILLGTFLVAASLCPAQDKTEQKAVVQPAVIQQTSPASGKEMFIQYCAPCHETDGKGTGPAAGAMKVLRAHGPDAACEETRRKIFGDSCVECNEIRERYRVGGPWFGGYARMGPAVQVAGQVS